MKKFLYGLCIALVLTTLALAQTAYHYKHKLKHQFDVNISIDERVLKQKIQEGPKEWMVQQIHSDLNAYKEKGITKQMLDTLCKDKGAQDLSLARFFISKGHISFAIDEKLLDSRQFRHILAAIKELNRQTPLPDVDFIISLEDSVNKEKGCPLFVFAKKSEVKSLVLIPDFKALTGYPRLRTQMEKGSQKFPWKTKTSQAFWRGATTGGWLTSKTWESIPRCKLALLSLHHPKELDARVNGVVQCDLDVPPLIKAKGITGCTVSQINHLKYKYLVDVDGNSCSFERYFWALLSNSLILKQMTPNIQWYYGALKPYEHFVPIKEDLSDLIEKYRWAVSHDEEAQKIAQNATEFVKNNLSIEDVFLYMNVLIREYAKLQRS